MPSNKSGFRRFTRFSAESYDLKGSVCGISEVRLKDFSIGGVAFVVNRPMSSKKKCTLDISVGGELYSIDGTVVWSRNLGDRLEKEETESSTYTIGFRFDSSWYGRASSMIYSLLN